MTERLRTIVLLLATITVVFGIERSGSLRWAEAALVEARMAALPARPQVTSSSSALTAAASGAWGCGHGGARPMPR